MYIKAEAGIRIDEKRSIWIELGAEPEEPTQELLNKLAEAAAAGALKAYANVAPTTDKKPDLRGFGE